MLTYKIFSRDPSEKLNFCNYLLPTTRHSKVLALSARAEWDSMLHIWHPSLFNVNLNSRHCGEFSHSSFFTPRAYIQASNNFLWCEKAFNYLRNGNNSTGNMVKTRFKKLFLHIPTNPLFSARNYVCGSLNWLYYLHAALFL